MGKLLRRGWRYLVAALSGKLDEVSDPRIQIEQAIEEAKNQHQLLSQQAAAVIGNERELELKLTRSIEETEKLQANARQALLLAEQARQAGDERKASSYEDSARAFATRLVSAEAAMRDLHTMHERASQASAQARAAVETNAMALQKRLAERTKLLSQLDQAKMQERLNAAMASMTELTPAGDTPTLDEVRDKIEARYARALGQAELTSNSVEARMIEVERAALDVEGAARLESIRETLGLPAATATPALGADADAAIEPPAQTTAGARRRGNSGRKASGGQGGARGRSTAKPTEKPTGDDS
jgi:phage shock protein A